MFELNKTLNVLILEGAGNVSEPSQVTLIIIIKYILDIYHRYIRPIESFC